MTTARRDHLNTIIKYGVLAGAAGGMAEIAWISSYAAVTGGNAATLARGVTTAAGVSALLPAAAVAVGIAMHMMLAVMLGVVLAGLWQSLARTQSVAACFGWTLTALAAVWAFNFFVALPAISPTFVQLVPLSVSLISKLLFGLAAAETLRRCTSADETRVVLTVRVRAAHKMR